MKMTTTNKPIIENKGMQMLLLALVLAMAFLFALTPYSNDAFGSPFDTNDTAISKVNVTNDYPNVRNIRFYTNISAVDIDLYPGTTTRVFCNATIDDANGYLDINSTNATIFHEFNSSTTLDNQSSHYTNSSCALVGGTGTTYESSCSFDVWYFAANGTWTCNVTARDQTISGSYLIATNTSIRNISKLVALNVTEVIDFGTLSVGQNSTGDFIANVTNLGNVRLDLNLHGYARNDGDQYAMVCEVGNISIGWEKYNLTTAGLNHGQMTNISGAVVGYTEPNVNLIRAQTDVAPSIQNTFWKIGIPAGLRGQCNGTVVFNAIDG